jgi:hypothetical protein
MHGDPAALDTGDSDKTGKAFWASVSVDSTPLILLHYHDHSYRQLPEKIRLRLPR